MRFLWKQLVWGIVAVVAVQTAIAVAERFITASGTPWRGLVRVQFGPLPSYFVLPVLELIESAADTFRHPRFPTELGLAGELPAGEFIFVGARPYRDTAMLELEFAGVSQHEVESLGRLSARIWAQHLATNQPPIQLEVVAVNSVDDRPASGRFLRTIPWRNRRPGAPYSQRLLKGAASA